MRILKGVEIFDLESNFWKMNTHFLVPEVFRSFYDSDKSKGKEKSSKLMWAIALYTDFGSRFKQLSDSEKKELIEKDFYGEKIKWESYAHLIKGWELFKTVMQRQIDQFERIMKEKEEYLETLKYNAANAEILEKLVLSNAKLYETYEKLQSKLAEEGDGGIVKGGSLESLSESGEI